MYGRVGSEVERRRTKVVMVIADVGLGLETERGEDKQSALYAIVSDTYYRLRNVHAMLFPKG